jgi:hypothetical protein
VVVGLRHGRDEKSVVQNVPLSLLCLFGLVVVVLLGVLRLDYQVILVGVRVVVVLLGVLRLDYQVILVGVRVV